MKITHCEVFAVANPNPRIGGPVWMFVRLDTDTGVSGYGEVFNSSIYTRPLLLAELLRAFVEDFVLGRDPHDVEMIYHSVYNSHFTHTGDLQKLAMLSGIEVALWDILGKNAGVPTYELWGGRVREKIPMYSYLGPGPDFDGTADEFWSDAALVGQRAIEYVEDGFTAFKLDPLPILTGTDSLASQFVPLQPTARLLDHAETVLGAIRGAIGHRADIIIGTHGQMTAAGAIRFAKVLEPFSPLWFEEPVPPELAEEMAKVARATSIPIAAGERLASKWEFARLARHGSAAIFNFDVSQVGGLLEARKVAALAEANYIQVTPHIFGGPLVAAASAQLAVTVPNLLIMEGNGKYDGVYADLLDEPLRWEKGYLIPSGRPGIGHDLNEELARDLAVDERQSFQYIRPRTDF